MNAGEYYGVVRFAQWLVTILREYPRELELENLTNLVHEGVTFSLDKPSGLHSKAIPYVLRLLVGCLDEEDAVLAWGWWKQAADENCTPDSILEALIKWVSIYYHPNEKAQRILLSYAATSFLSAPFHTEAEWQFGTFMHALHFMLGETRFMFESDEGRALYMAERMQDKAINQQQIEDRISGRTGTKQVHRYFSGEAAGIAQSREDKLWNALKDAAGSGGIDVKEIDLWPVSGLSRYISSKELINTLKTVRDHAFKEATEALLHWLLGTHVGDDVDRFKHDVERCWRGAEQGSVLEEVLAIIFNEVNRR